MVNTVGDVLDVEPLARCQILVLGYLTPRTRREATTRFRPFPASKECSAQGKPLTTAISGEGGSAETIELCWQVGSWDTHTVHWLFVCYV